MNAAMLMDILRQRRRAFILLLLLIAISLGSMVYRSIVQEPELAQLQQQWFDSRQLAAGVASSPAVVFDKGKEDLKRVSELTPPRTQFVRLLSDIYETAANNQVTVGEFTYKPQAVNEKTVTSYALNLKVTGSYAAIKSFIVDMERMRQLVVIDGLMVTGGTEEVGGIVTLVLPFSAYFLTEAR